MCGRFVLITNILSLGEHFQLNLNNAVLIPRYNIAPNRAIPVIIKDNLEFATWGIKLPNIPGSLIINAKFETIFTKNMFRFAIKNNRCLIPANGFFEWKNVGDQKIPYYIQVRNQPILGLAGLLIGNHCVILTTATLKDKYKEGFHERLPLIIKPECYKFWLDFKKSNLEVIKSSNLQVEQDKLFHFQVMKQVNNVKFDNSMCIKPVNVTF